MPIRPRHLLPLLLTLTALPALALAQQDGGLQQRMSKTEFTAAGLDKLSPQELVNLNAWLSSHPKVTTRMVNSSGKQVFYADHKKRSTIDTRINGHFDGWSKGHTFTMANRQQWMVTDPDPHSCNPSDNTEVKIKPSILGSWLMYVPSCYENVHVKRIR